MRSRKPAEGTGRPARARCRAKERRFDVSYVEVKNHSQKQCQKKGGQLNRIQEQGVTFLGEYMTEFTTDRDWS